MRKYRLEDPTDHRLKIKKYGRYAVYFVAWNALGYCLFQYFSNEKRKKYADFDKWSYTQQILSFWKGDGDMIKIKHMKGLSVQSTETITFKDWRDETNKDRFSEKDISLEK